MLVLRDPWCCGRGRLLQCLRCSCTGGSLGSGTSRGGGLEEAKNQGSRPLLLFSHRTPEPLSSQPFDDEQRGSFIAQSQQPAWIV